jgi:hypothetical protein
VHGRDLGDGLVRFVHEDEEVLGEVVDERGRWLAGLPPGKVTRVVLDALAAAHLLQHLEVVEGALRESLLLDQLIGGVELDQARAQLLPDRGHGAYQLVGGSHVVRSGKYRDLVEPAQHLAAQGIDFGNRLDLVAPPLDAQGLLPLVRREDLDDVATHAEGAAREVHVVALVLDFDQPAQDGVTPHLEPRHEVDLHAQIGLGGANAVDA